ncbi:MAG: hypothetical protein KGJ89_02260 [Patescibacteria group bacterium]|nr:hypothetical protein [Patescibacteria group bacterium]MDE2015700.1 hypothetical protein [Patescibacteria group bacterium]MDE2226758.1 hypothetical protein [Patescibacteria group bacterium]
MKDTKSLKIVAIAVFIVVVGTIWYFVSATKTPVTDQGAPTTNATSSQPQPVTNNTGQVKSPSSGQTTTTQVSGIKITSPTVSAKLALSQNNTIQWDKESGFTGGIYLVNASDKSVVGWITSETNVHQVSYTWNTRDLYIARYSPTKKTVSAGNYIIKIKFDSTKLPEVSSGEFSLVYTSELHPSSYSVTINNLAFDQPSLSLNKGDKLTIVNNDQVDHKITLTGFSPFVIPIGSSFTFDTSVLFPGSYVFYSAAYPTLKLSVKVQ